MNDIFNAIYKMNGEPYFVGGYVRDSVLGLKPKDIDIEVFGLTPAELVAVLCQFGEVDSVGVSFGILKLKRYGQEFDFSTPRREIKTGPKHQDFIVVPDPNMSLREAASRRDFTMNAMYMDPAGNITDLFGGLTDLNDGVLHITSDQFKDDPLRVLRGMQFCGRFNLIPSNTTLNVSRSLVDEYDTIPKDRIWQEWSKWAEKSTVPSMGLTFLRDSGWVKHYPELQACIRCPQSPKYHPEGDVWNHLLACVDVANDRFTALGHDLGKPATTRFENDWISPGHAERSEPFEFFTRIGMPFKPRDKAVEIIQHHMIHYNTPSKRSVRRLLAGLKHCTIKEIAALIMVDYAGRPPTEPYVPDNLTKILELAELVQDEVAPILLGRHLIELGVKPGKDMGVILKSAHEAQLDGVFNDLNGAMDWYLGYIES